MKKMICGLVSLSTLLSGCTTHEHYYTVERRVYTRPEHHYYKASPSVSSEAPESFRAVEAPGSYSQ